MVTKSNKFIFIPLVWCLAAGCRDGDGFTTEVETEVGKVQIVKTTVDSCLYVLSPSNSLFEFANYCDSGYVYYFNDSLKHMYNLKGEFYTRRWRGELQQVNLVGDSMQYLVYVPELRTEDVICRVSLFRLESNGDSLELVRDTVNRINLEYTVRKSYNDVDSLLVWLEFRHVLLGIEMPEIFSKWIMLQNIERVPSAKDSGSARSDALESNS